MKLERTREHRVAANLGLKAFYKMLIYDNFIHADLHSGNILVRIKDSDTSKFNQFKNMLEEGFYDLVEDAAEYIVPLFEKFVLKKPLKVNYYNTNRFLYWRKKRYLMNNNFGTS